MNVRGWVYVIVNVSMPGLVKVGFSTKDPVMRAVEFDGAGLPDPYQVAYDLLVFDPRGVEQRAHMLLSQYRYQKEWFRCSTEVAARAISEAAEGRVVEATSRTLSGSAPAESSRPDATQDNKGSLRAFRPSPALAEIVGLSPLTRPEVTQRLWNYIKANKLQDSAKKTMINSDAKLRPIFMKAQVSMFEMTKLINGHLK